MALITRNLISFVLALALVLPGIGSLAAAGNDTEVIWIDVRPAQDFRRGHIEGAVNIPHGDIGHRILQAVPHTFVEVHLYDGNNGTFAGLALELLMEMGFESVYNEGGYEQLLEKLAKPAAEN